MSDPRYKPRDFCRQPDLFGKAELIEWVPTRGRQGAWATAAKLQHGVAVRIRKRLREKKMSFKVYADLAGTSYDRLMKILRGDAIMRLEDIAMADHLLGGVIAR